MRDGVALLAILARVRRRLRLLAAFEGAVVASALALAALALWFGITRWRAGAMPTAAMALRAVTAALGLGAVGGLLAGVRRIPLVRCARILDRTLGGHDRTLSALSFWQAGAPDRMTPYMASAVADAVRRGAAVAPGVVAPFRRPRGVAALAAAVMLVGLAALFPLPARGSRVAARSASAVAAVPGPRVRMARGALDPEREEAAAALRAAGTLGDPELARLARALAATVQELSTGGLARADALDQLADLQRRSQDAADDAADLRQGLEQAGRALQGASATQDSGHAIEAQDPAATEKSMNDLAAKAGEAASAERARIATALDRAGDRAHAADHHNTGADARPPGTPSPAAGAAPASGSGDITVISTAEPDTDNGNDTDDKTGPERRRRLARDEKQPAPPAHTSSSSSVSAPPERRLHRLERELRETASACRADPEACRRKLQRQAHALPRMEDEARSSGSRQRLAEAVRQLRERLRREGAGGVGRTREEKRFMRSARGDAARKGEQPGQEDRDRDSPLYAQDTDSMSDERDDIDGDGDRIGDGDSDGDGDRDVDGDGNGDGNGFSGAGRAGPSGAGAEAAADSAAGSGGQENATGQGIGTGRGGDPLGERGAMTTNGRARQAQVRNGAGPSRSEVIQSAARRGFAHTTYQGVYTDYQAAVEESLDASAVPPGRRYIVRRYFQLIRPQSSRAPR